MSDPAPRLAAVALFPCEKLVMVAASFWQRLKDWRIRQGGLSADERRAAGRFACNVATRYWASGEASTPHLPGTVSNVSRGGLSLIAPERAEPGALLTVELPSPAGKPHHTVLACVVHAAPRADGTWIVGCSLADGLTEQELEAFGAARERPTAPDDQRAWRRFPCAVSASCQTLAPEEEAAWLAEVVDISPTGLGLRTQRDVAAGTLLSVKLHGSQGQAPASLLACVVHVSPDDDGGDCLLGCNFIRELKEAELKALL